MPIPPFDLDCRVTPETGREDKIELSLGNWIITGSPAILDGIRQHMATPPAGMNPAQYPEAQFYGWIFNHPQQLNSLRLPLTIRRRTLWPNTADAVLPPLFSGTWMFKFSNNGNSESRQIVTELILSLNPLRFVRHNSVPSPMPSADSPDWPAPSLMEASLQPPGYGEYSLDGNDNWLPNTRYLAAWTNNERWQKHLKNYIYGIIGVFNQELNRVISDEGGSFQFVEKFSLKKVELAWEFWHSDPIELAKNLAPHLRAYRGLNSSTSFYPVPVDEHVVNSLSTTISLGNKRALRVYAKTNRRLRFEIIQEKPNIRQLLGEPESLPGVRPPRLHHQIFLCLSALREEAAVQLNSVLEYLSSRLQVESSPKSGLSLVIQIASILKNPDLTRTIILLLLDGAICARNAGRELLGACELLADEGILTYHATRYVYDVTEGYKYGLAMLRIAPHGRIITRARQRTRSQN